MELVAHARWWWTCSLIEPSLQLVQVCRVALAWLVPVLAADSWIHAWTVAEERAYGTRGTVYKPPVVKDARMWVDRRDCSVTLSRCVLFAWHVLEYTHTSPSVTIVITIYSNWTRSAVARDAFTRHLYNRPAHLHRLSSACTSHIRLWKHNLARLHMLRLSLTLRLRSPTVHERTPQHTA